MRSLLLGLSVAFVCADSSASGSAEAAKAVDTVFQNMLDQAGIRDGALIIYAPGGHEIHRKITGRFSTAEAIPVASASKLASGLMLMRLVGQGSLQIDSRPANIIPDWPQDKQAIALRHLLSFTSGLSSETLCSFNPRASLEECTQKIMQGAPQAEPGASFSYGSTHLTVAGRMAELSTGKKWNALFAETLSKPLGIASATYYALPNREKGDLNPLVAGGLVISTDDYAKLLELLYHKGKYHGAELIPAPLVDQMARQHFPQAQIVKSPLRETEFSYRYGLTLWLECDSAVNLPCDQQGASSPGAFGFTPWVSWKDQYFAIIAMKESSGHWMTGVRIQNALKPKIAWLMQLISGKK